jgi:hypothetical protein
LFYSPGTAIYFSPAGAARLHPRTAPVRAVPHRCSYLQAGRVFHPLRLARILL